MRSERFVDRRVTNLRSGEPLERRRIARVAQPRPGVVETSAAEQRGSRRPGRAVAVEPVGPRLRAEREELGEVTDGGHRAGGRDPNEAVREEGVAEQQGHVVVGGANRRGRP